MADTARFVILEDHPLFREALISLVAMSCPPARMSYAGANIDEARETIRAHGADCVILDLDLGDGRAPIANVISMVETGVPVLAVSALGASATIRSAFSAGVCGFISKGAEPEEFTAAVSAALAGETFTSAEAASALLSETSDVTLSEQERRALTLYASGLKMRAVGSAMGISEETAREYIRRLRGKYEKAGRPLPTKTDLFIVAVEEGLLAAR